MKPIKNILYFVLALLTLVYIGFLCYINIAGTASQTLNYIAIYGGLAIALMYAFINFLGSPLKIVFFILLVVSVVVLILTIAIPEVFRNLFGMNGDNANAIISLLRL